MEEDDREWQRGKTKLETREEDRPATQHMVACLMVLRQAPKEVVILADAKRDIEAAVAFAEWLASDKWNNFQAFDMLTATEKTNYVNRLTSEHLRDYAGATRANPPAVGAYE